MTCRPAVLLAALALLVSAGRASAAPVAPV
ncbi:MAG: hypothetical protein JWQ18_2032, partial [Conexibacter sp.]|nr:hypothetical protein [Conexibacter sp.]